VQVLADLDRDPIRTDVDRPSGGGGADDRVAPDWEAVFDRQEELLEDYRAAFGGG